MILALKLLPTLFFIVVVSLANRRSGPRQRRGDAVGRLTGGAA